MHINKELKDRIIQLIKEYESSEESVTNLADNILEQIDGPRLSLQELEDIKLAVQDLLRYYEDLVTRGHEVRIMELKQLEFKVTELIYTHRNKFLN